MKWYNHKLHRIHLNDMKSFKDENEMRGVYQSWAITVANRFERSYPRIGILNFSDLLQEGYVGFYKSWNKLNWELIESHHSDERIGMITNYLKISIKRHIVRAITRDRETIRIPEHYYMKEEHGRQYETDIFLSRTFSSFFLPEVLDVSDEGGDYYADLLNELLNDLMDHMLTPIEKVVIKKFYGIDEAYDKPVNQTRIAEYCSKTVSNIQNIKHRAIKKLKQEDNLKIIEKKVENLMI